MIVDSEDFFVSVESSRFRLSTSSDDCLWTDATLSVMARRIGIIQILSTLHSQHGLIMSSPVGEH